MKLEVKETTCYYRLYYKRSTFACGHICNRTCGDYYGSKEEGKLVFKQRKKEGFYPSFFDSNHKNKIIVPRPMHIETKATKK